MRVFTGLWSADDTAPTLYHVCVNHLASCLTIHPQNWSLIFASSRISRANLCSNCVCNWRSIACTEVYIALVRFISSSSSFQTSPTEYHHHYHMDFIDHKELNGVSRRNLHQKDCKCVWNYCGMAQGETDLAPMSPCALSFSCSIGWVFFFCWGRAGAWSKRHFVVLESAYVGQTCAFWKICKAKLLMIFHKAA